MDLNSIDKYLGWRLKLGRKLCDFSQKDLAQKMGVSFEQIQGYENALDKVSARKIFQFSIILDRDPNWFFEDCSLKFEQKLSLKSLSGKSLSEENDILDMVTHYSKLPTHTQKALLRFIRNLNKRAADNELPSFSSRSFKNRTK